MTDGNEFAKATRESERGLLAEIVYLVRRQKKWWLVPFLIALLVLGLLVVLAGTGAAPFIYTLF